MTTIVSCEKLMLASDLCYGLDTRGNTIMLRAFMPLKPIERGDKYTVVKRYGRGQVRTFLVANNLLEPYCTIHEWVWGTDNIKEDNEMVITMNDSRQRTVQLVHLCLCKTHQQGGSH